MSNQRSSGCVGHSKHRKANWHGRAGTASEKAKRKVLRQEQEQERERSKFQKGKRRLQQWSDNVRDLFK